MERLALPGAQERPELDLAPVALQRQVLLDRARRRCSRSRTQNGLACQRRTRPRGSRRTTVMRSGQSRSSSVAARRASSAGSRGRAPTKAADQERQHPPGRLGAGEPDQRQREARGERAPPARSEPFARQRAVRPAASARAAADRLRANGSAAALARPPAPAVVRPHGRSVRRAVVPHVAGSAASRRCAPAAGSAASTRASRRAAAPSRRARSPAGRSAACRRRSRRRTGTTAPDRKAPHRRDVVPERELPPDSPCSAAACPAARGSAAGRR